VAVTYWPPNPSLATSSSATSDFLFLIFVPLAFSIVIGFAFASDQSPIWIVFHKKD
jgi:hypothetical protein